MFIQNQVLSLRSKAPIKLTKPREPIFRYQPSLVKTIFLQIFLVCVLALLLYKLNRNNAYLIIFIYFIASAIWNNSSIYGIDLTTTHLIFNSRNLFGIKKPEREIPLHQIKDCFIDEVKEPHFILNSIFRSNQLYRNITRPIIVFKLRDGSTLNSEMIGSRRTTEQFIKLTLQGIQSS